MNNIKEKLKELTDRSDEEIVIIGEILNNHFVIGKSKNFPMTSTYIKSFKGESICKNYHLIY